MLDACLAIMVVSRALARLCICVDATVQLLLSATVVLRCHTVHRQRARKWLQLAGS